MTTALGMCGAESVVVAAVASLAQLVGEQRLVPVELAGHGLRVRVEQELARDCTGRPWPGSYGPCTR